MNELVYRTESYKIIGACFEVYNHKGAGFTEAVYQECLAIEFEIQRIPFVSQPQLQLGYKDRVLEHYFRPDFVCFNKIVIEIKSVSKLVDSHVAQTLNYLNGAKHALGILVNFGAYPKLEYRRIVNERSKPSDAVRKEIESWIE